MIDKLIARQGEMSDADFARLLDVPRETWTKTRTGERPIRHRMATAIVRAFPDLEGDVLSLLRSGTQVSNSETAITSGRKQPTALVAAAP